MAVTGLSLTKRNWYVCNADPGKRDDLEECKAEGATVFYWRAIANSMMANIHDLVSSSTMRMGDMTTQTFHQKNAERNRMAFRHGITGWETFFDEEGEPIEYATEGDMVGGKTYTVISDDVMNRIPLQIVNEVGAHVYNSNSMGEADRKKFEAVLSRLGGSPDGAALNVETPNAENEDAPETQNTSEGKQTKPPTPTRMARSTKAKSGTGKTRSPESGKTSAQGS
jgi:hypothetical protein